MKIWQKTIAVISTFALLFNSIVAPLTVLAQETPTPEPTSAPVNSPTPTDTASPTVTPAPTDTIAPTPTPTETPIPTATPTVTPEPTPTQTPSPWTFENVELNKEYQSGGVTLTFTKLPSPAGNIKIEEITLTQEQIKQTGSLSNKAYDITSDMTDGSFSYNLSLPIPDASKGKAVEVKFAEELSNIGSAAKVENTLTKTDTSVSVTSLDHFTVFVVSGLTTPTTTTLVDSLQPNWDAGVWSAYYAPDSDTSAGVSPGSTAVFDGREAGIIKAGITAEPSGPSVGHYMDEGLFGFKPTVTINDLAAGTLTYVVKNQTGVNPMWMTIEIDTGVVGNRSDNTIYQFMPTPNPAGWNTFNAGAGLWQQWTTPTSGITVGDPMTLGAIATANTGRNVVRAYLRLGQGDSYYNGGTGTTAWVDKVTIGGITYDFVVNRATTSCTGALVTPPVGTTACYSTIQAAVNAASSGDTINVAAGTYAENVTIPTGKSLTIQGQGGPAYIATANTLTLASDIAFTNFSAETSGTSIQINPGGKIQDGIGFAVAGSTINVAAGTYYENVIVNKSVNLRGAQAGIDPRSASAGGPGTRNQVTPTGETVVIPGISDLDAGNIFTVLANNVTIDGFWIDGTNLGGANPSLTPDTGLTVGSTEVFAIHAIYNGDDNTSTYFPITGAVVQNNIVKNFADLGISVFNNNDSVSHDNLITQNFVTNLNGPGVYGPPAAISILYDGYSSVINNEVTNSVLGIYTENNFASVPGMSAPVISGNDVSTTRAGIWHNSTSGTAPTFTISDNIIRTWDAGIGHAGEKNVGLFLSTIMGTAQVNISNNMIMPGAFRGIQVIWATAGLTIHGGSVSGARDTGILVYNIANSSAPGLGSWGAAGQPTTVTLDGVSVSGSATGVRVWDNGGGKNVTVIINGSSITGGTTGLQVDGALATMAGHSDTITGNTNGVVNNNTSTSINLENNWWGSASGPYDNKTLPGTPNYNNLSGTGNSVTSYVDYKPWCTDLGCATFSSANPTTTVATDMTSTDATLNGTNGSYYAIGHSFWASLATFSTASPTLPSGVFSTLDLGAKGANTAFSALLSSITGLLPITPSTPYYFAAWSLVDGTWYPGEILTFTTTAPTPPDTTPNAFSFTDQTDVALNTVIESNTITVAGITASADVSIVGGEFSIDGGGTWFDSLTSRAVIDGDTVRVRHTSSASNSTAVNTTLTIGDVSDTFTSTTIVDITPPDICANIDGIQTGVPDGMHLDASGLNCVNFSQAGPPPQGPYTPPGQVLGINTSVPLNNWPKLAYAYGANDNNVLGADTEVTGTLEPSPSPIASPEVTNEPVITNPGFFKWILTHKKISGGIALILLAVTYGLYRLSKKNK